MYRSFWKLLAAVAGLMVMFAIGPSAQPAIKTGTIVERDFGVTIRAARWPTPIIAICWENPTNENLRLRESVRLIVASTWERNSAVRFVGWSSCETGQPGVHVRISKSPGQRSVALTVGRYLDTFDDGVILDSGIADTIRQCRDEQPFACGGAIVVHEFGHILGFTHEQNRADAPVDCASERAGSFGDYNLTAYDPLSVMNYCNAQWKGSGQLSALDVEAVQKFYGLPP